MGVQGLLSYCLRNQSKCVEFVDLVEVSQQRGGIEILVDFNSFMNILRDNFMRYLEKTTGNIYLMIIGAENKTLDAYFTHLINSLASVKIKFVWFIDGGKGATLELLESKLSTWIQRHHNWIPRLHEIMKVCAGQRDMVDNDELIVPLLLSTQMRGTLIKLNSEIVQCSSGEADDCIAKALIDRPNAFAILTNDSDFCLFDGCCFVPTSLFDLDNDLKMSDASFLNLSTPPKLRVGIIVSASLLIHFKFSTHDQIVDMGILKGNDYTKTVMTPKLYQSIGIHRYRDIQEVAQFIRRCGRLEQCPPMLAAIRRDRGLREAIDYARKFYGLQLCDQLAARPANDYERFLIDKITERRYNAEVFTIYNQFFWRRTVVEDPSPGHPCVEIALTPLRQFIYRMILPFGRDFVTEYGRGPHEALRTDTVRPHDQTDRNVPFSRCIDTTKIHKNLDIFSYIIRHMEQPGQGENFIKLYGWKNGFVFSLLRYFLLLNYKQNLYLSREEFLALVVTVTLHDSEESYQKCVIRPLPRTVTIASWFMDLYRHAYIYLGALLCVTHEFPEASDIFCGSRWTVLHSFVEQQAWMRACQCVDPQRLNFARNNMTKVLREKRNQISKLVSGYFHFTGTL